MANWIDWLDTMAPDWDFAYGTYVHHIVKDDFAFDLLFSYEEGRKYLDSCAHMRVSMPADQMVLHRLAWNVDNIATCQEALVG